MLVARWAIGRAQLPGLFIIELNLANPRRKHCGIGFLGAVPLKQHFEQLIGRDRNNQENAARHSNHKHPAQDVSETLDQ